MEPWYFYLEVSFEGFVSGCIFVHLNRVVADVVLAFAQLREVWYRISVAFPLVQTSSEVLLLLFCTRVVVVVIATLTTVVFLVACVCGTGAYLQQRTAGQHQCC